MKGVYQWDGDGELADPWKGASAARTSDRLRCASFGLTRGCGAAAAAGFRGGDADTLRLPWPDRGAMSEDAPRIAGCRSDGGVLCSEALALLCASTRFEKRVAGRAFGL